MLTVGHRTELTLSFKKQCLPLRLSPSPPPKRNIKPKPQLQQIGPCTVPPTLTPVESSDEDAEVESIRNLSTFSITQPGRTGRSNSAKDNTFEGSPTDTTDMPPPSRNGLKRPPMTRQRSNGISCLVPPSIAVNKEDGRRVPTPIYGHFTSTDVNMDTSEASMNSFIHPSARFQLRNDNHNMLSPMMSEDGESEAEWWRKRQLPSPAQSPIGSQHMEMDGLPSPGMLDALSFVNIRTHNSEKNNGLLPQGSPPLTTASSTTSKGHAMFERRSPVTSPHPRKGKLVMGFRPDCIKCQKRVPGHYSHIVWE